jgi:hypothetical protein
MTFSRKGFPKVQVQKESAKSLFSFAKQQHKRRYRKAPLNASLYTYRQSRLCNALKYIVLDSL